MYHVLYENDPLDEDEARCTCLFAKDAKSYEMIAGR